jgi:hypothetical protein
MGITVVPAKKHTDCGSSLFAAALGSTTEALLQHHPISACCQISHLVSHWLVLDLSINKCQQQSQGLACCKSQQRVLSASLLVAAVYAVVDCDVRIYLRRDLGCVDHGC